MKGFFLLATFLACCVQAGDPPPYALEVNLGNTEYIGRLDGDRWLLYSEPPEVRVLRGLTMLERNWCKVHIKDVDATFSMFLPNRAVEAVSVTGGKVTLLLFTQACCEQGGATRYSGVAYLYDNGKVTRGTFVQKTLDWDDKSGYGRLLKTRSTGCPECDRLLEESKEGK